MTKEDFKKIILEKIYHKKRLKEIINGKKYKIIIPEVDIDIEDDFDFSTDLN